MPSGNPNMGTNKTTGTSSAMGSRSANAATGPGNYGGSSSMGSRSANAATGPAGYGGSSGGSMGSRSANAATGPGGYGGGNGNTGGFQSTGLNNSLAGLNRTDRAVVEAGARIGRDFGVGTARGIVAASEIAKTAFGELGNRYDTPENLAAVSRNVLNRMGLAQNYGRYRGSIEGVLAGYDASGYGYGFGRGKALAKAGVGPLGNSAFQSAKFGTPAYNAGLASLTGELTGTGPALPDFVRTATNYHNPDVSNPSWGRNARQFGPHAFSNPDKGFGPSAVAASNARISQGVNPSMPESVTASRAPIPRDKPESFAMARAQPIPASLEEQAGLTGGLRSAFPSRPIEIGGAFPAAAKYQDRLPAETTIAGRPAPQQNFTSRIASRPEYAGAFPGAPVTDNFPARPEARPGFASQVTARPEPPQNFVSRVESRPGVPASFNSRIAGRPEALQGFTSRVAGRPGLPLGGPAPATYSNPPRSFAGIPGNGMAQIDPVAGPAPPAPIGLADFGFNPVRGGNAGSSMFRRIAKELARKKQQQSASQGGTYYPVNPLGPYSGPLGTLPA